MTAQSSGPDWGPFSLAVTGLLGAIAAAIAAITALGKPAEKVVPPINLTLDGVANLVDELQNERTHYEAQRERREARIEMLESVLSARDQTIRDLQGGGNE